VRAARRPPRYHVVGETEGVLDELLRDAPVLLCLVDVRQAHLEPVGKKLSALVAKRIDHRKHLRPRAIDIARVKELAQPTGTPLAADAACERKQVVDRQEPVLFKGADDGDVTVGEV